MTSPSPHTYIHYKPLKILCGVCASRAAARWITSRTPAREGAWHFHFSVALSATLPWAHPSSTHSRGWRGNTHCAPPSLIPDWGPAAHSRDNKQIQLARRRGDRQEWPRWSFNNPWTTVKIIMTQRGHVEAHTHAEDDTHLTRHILLLFGGGGGGCYPVYSALLCLYDCVLHSGHMKETVCEKEKKKKSHIFTEHHCHCHWTASLKREGEIKGEWSDGLWRCRLTLPRRWRTNF